MKTKSKLPVFIIVYILILAAAYVFGINQMKKEDERKAQAIEEKKLAQQQTEDKAEDTRITSVRDIPSESLSKMKEYTFDAVEAYIADDNHFRNLINDTFSRYPKYSNENLFGDDGLGHNMAYALSDSDAISKTIDKKVEYDSCLLLSSKQSPDKGKIIFIYRIPFFIHSEENNHGDFAITEDFDITVEDTIYSAVSYDIDISDKHGSILSDYSRYDFSASNCEIDYDNFYLKHITTLKDRYEILGGEE